MKRIFVCSCAAFAHLLSLSGHAQDNASKNTQADCVSFKGYWVAETNKQSPKEAIIYFYNNENLLVYKKEIKDQKLKLNKTATRLQLKATLEDAIAAYENGVAANKEKQPVRLANH